MTGSPKAPPPQSVPTSSTTVSEFPEFAQPAAEDLLSRATQLSSTPFQPTLPGAEQRLQGFSPEQEAAFGQFTQRGLFGNPLTNAAERATFGQLTTDPTQNPLVDRLVQTAQGDIVDQFNLNVAPSLAARNKLSGSFGNTGLQETEAAQRFGLARALGDVESQIRLPAFENQSARQLQAAGLSPTFAAQRLQDTTGLLGVGQTRQQFGQAGRDIEFSNLLQQREEPLQQLDILARALSAVTAGGNLGTRSQTGTQFFQPQAGSNDLLGLLGAGGSFLGGAGLLASGLGGL